jgi:hypothetical protein
MCCGNGSGVVAQCLEFAEDTLEAHYSSGPELQQIVPVKVLLQALSVAQCVAVWRTGSASRPRLIDAAGLRAVPNAAIIVGIGS